MSSLLLKRGSGPPLFRGHLSSVLEEGSALCVSSSSIDTEGNDQNLTVHGQGYPYSTNLVKISLIPYLFHLCIHLPLKLLTTPYILSQDVGCMLHSNLGVLCLWTWFLNGSQG